MKAAIGILMIGLGIGLAVIIGQRMSTDAMAVVIGVAVGVAASIPTSLLMVALLRRQRQAFTPEPPPQMPQLQQPNFIMLSPEMFGRQQQPLPMPPQYIGDAGVRQIRVMGDDNNVR